MIGHFEFCILNFALISWQALYCTIHQTTELPPEPPSIGQCVRWIAKLGGFLGRKSDGELGVTVIQNAKLRMQN